MSTTVSDIINLESVNVFDLPIITEGAVVSIYNTLYLIDFRRLKCALKKSFNVLLKNPQNIHVRNMCHFKQNLIQEEIHCVHRKLRIYVR